MSNFTVSIRFYYDTQSIANFTTIWKMIAVGYWDKASKCKKCLINQWQSQVKA